MIPTAENIKKLQDEKLQIHKKISNTFIENAISNSNASALKIIYYLSSKVDKIDFNKDYNTLELDLKAMLKYTELTAQNIRDNIKKMQQTSITFIDEDQNIESGINLLPEYSFHWNKNRVDIVLNSKIATLIIEVTKKYTFINTKELMRLKNKNSIRLLPLLHKIDGYDVKQKTLSISELNALFGTNYKRLSEIERSLLNKVKIELDNNSKLTFAFELNYESVGRGRPKATSITIKTIVKNNYQSTIFSNFEDANTNEMTQQKETEDKYKKYVIDKFYIDKIENEFNMSPQEIMLEQRVFLDYCKKNNKKYKDMSRSFYTHIKNQKSM